MSRRTRKQHRITLRIGDQVKQELEEVARRYDQDEAEVTRTAVVIGLAVLRSAVAGRLVVPGLDVNLGSQDKPEE